ncbi:helix-turn-helix transcriptional regulator [Flavobacterium sp. GN10]|uniref:Helix-turn-helix transcriptional regulator n=1 Tax=Flavobacterium tagetis TaxID=2801336 RepID=A0ABS1KA48_9FLAO|nr:helix-turn-helix transcriptional regulator [Flavobacterium tagetis]MBL0736062.1 helix-turn-helix transcriptional regulator [Flavobacterium tagetis]
MIKQKLTNKRTERNFSQEKMAELLGISQSQYNRRENGVTKISKNEWDKMAKILNTTLESIYEPEDGIYIIDNKSSGDNISHAQNNFHQLPNHILETMRKYIEKLEDENQVLKDEIKVLKNNC